MEDRVQAEQLCGPVHHHHLQLGTCGRTVPLSHTVNQHIDIGTGNERLALNPGLLTLVAYISARIDSKLVIDGK